MRQVLDGIRYDTDKAELIGETHSYRDRRDPRTGFLVNHGWSESLYRSPGGKLFLFGQGTEGTRWNRMTPEGADGAIRPITEDEARTWVEKYCTADVYDGVWPGEAVDA